MPSVSKRQEAAMRAAAHSKKFSDKIGIPQDVAREFEAADKAKAKSKKEKKHV